MPLLLLLSLLRTATAVVGTLKIFRQKINETDINSRQPSEYTWEPNAFNCTFLTLFPSLSLSLTLSSAGEYHMFMSFAVLLLDSTRTAFF